MKDARIISAAIDSRQAYETVRPFVSEDEFTPMGAHWWKIIGEWYEADKAADKADPQIIKDRGLRAIGERHKDTMEGWFDNLPASVSPENVALELLDIKRYAKGNELAAAVANNAERDELIPLVREYEDLLQATSLRKGDVNYGADWDSLMQTTGSENKVKLLPSLLTERTEGGALPGDHIVVFGRPEVGKTLFAINMTAGFLRQQKRVLYVGNEDSIEKIKLRIVYNLSGMNSRQAEAHWPEAIRRAKAKGLDNLVAVHLHDGNVYDIEELIKQHKPDVLVLDQIRNVRGVAKAGDNITSRLNQVAIDVRALLSRYGLIGLSITQAHAGEHNKPKVWLDSDDVDSSRTGIPAQADLLIGIGADHEMLNHETRAVSLCKNKLGGNHEGFTIQLDRQRSKVL